MGKTTVVIDTILMDEALKVTHLKTKKEVIEAGLKELIKKEKRRELRSSLGTFDLNLSLEKLDLMRESS